MPGPLRDEGRCHDGGPIDPKQRELIAKALRRESGPVIGFVIALIIIIALFLFEL